MYILRSDLRYAKMGSDKKTAMRYRKVGSPPFAETNVDDLMTIKRRTLDERDVFMDTNMTRPRLPGRERHTPPQLPVSKWVEGIVAHDAHPSAANTLATVLFESDMSNKNRLSAVFVFALLKTAYVVCSDAKRLLHVSFVSSTRLPL